MPNQISYLLIATKIFDLAVCAPRLFKMVSNANKPISRPVPSPVPSFAPTYKNIWGHRWGHRSALTFALIYNDKGIWIRTAIDLFVNIVFMCVYFPYDIVFQNSTISDSLDIYYTIVFGIDIILNFNLAIEKPNGK